MDIWKWVRAKEHDLRDQGQHRLAEYVNTIPEDTVSNRHSNVDLYADEAIKLARDLNESWVEVFLRHWRLQSAVLHRQEARGLVREAVSLLEFSHRPENIDCPQSVCVIQDLTACYRAADGPGYYQERIDTCLEAMEKITPHRTCFACIGAELILAYSDSGQYEKGLEKINWIESEMLSAGVIDLGVEISLTKALILLRLGMHDAAERVLKPLSSKTVSEVFRLQAVVLQSLNAVCSGSIEKAMKILPSYNDIADNSNTHAAWIEVLYLSTQSQKKILDSFPQYIESAMEVIQHAEYRGANRQTFTMGVQLSYIFRQLGDQYRAQLAIAFSERVISLLRGDFGALRQLEDAKQFD